MNTAGKVAIGTGIAAFVLWASGKINKASKLADNLYVDTTVTRADVKFSNTTFGLKVDIRNVSGFRISIKNIFSKVFLNTNDGKRVEIGITSVSDKLDINKGVTTFYPDLKVSNLTLAANLPKTQKIEVVTWYDIAGQQLSYTSEIDLAGFVGMVKSKVGIGSPLI